MPKKEREKVLQNLIDTPDLDNISDLEVLEYLLSFFMPKTNIKVLARDLIDNFDSFYGVLCATPQELCRINGMTNTVAHLLFNLLAVIRRAELTNIDRSMRISTVTDAVKRLKPYFLARNHERIYLMMLDYNNKILNIECLSKGSAQASAMDVNAVVSSMSRMNSSKIIIAHNHPGGTNLASPDDVRVTESILLMIINMGKIVLDHIIFAGDDYYSFYERNGIKDIFLRRDISVALLREMVANGILNKYVLETTPNLFDKDFIHPTNLKYSSGK